MLGHLKIPFKLLQGLAKGRLPQLVKELTISAVICDFAPLRVPMGWVKDVSVEMDKLNVPLIQVRGYGIYSDVVIKFGLFECDWREMCALPAHLVCMYLH